MTPRMSRRSFLTCARSTPNPTHPSPTAPEVSNPPARSFLESFYAQRAHAQCPPLVYEPTCLVWDGSDDLQPKLRAGLKT